MPRMEGQDRRGPGPSLRRARVFVRTAAVTLVLLLAQAGPAAAADPTPTPTLPAGVRPVVISATWAGTDACGTGFYWRLLAWNVGSLGGPRYAFASLRHEFTTCIDGRAGTRSEVQINGTFSGGPDGVFEAVGPEGPGPVVLDGGRLAHLGELMALVWPANAFADWGIGDQPPTEGPGGMSPPSEAPRSSAWVEVTPATEAHPTEPPASEFMPVVAALGGRVVAAAGPSDAFMKLAMIAARAPGLVGGDWSGSPLPAPLASTPADGGRAIQKGDVIEPGDEVQTGSGAWVTLEFFGGSFARAEPDTRLAAHPTAVYLGSGRATVFVILGTSPFVVAARDFVATVRSGHVQLAITDDRVTVECQKGSIQFVVRGVPGTVTLGPGRRALVSADGRIETEAYDPPELGAPWDPPPNMGAAGGPPAWGLALAVVIGVGVTVLVGAAIVRRRRRTSSPVSPG